MFQGREDLRHCFCHLNKQHFPGGCFFFTDSRTTDTDKKQYQPDSCHFLLLACFLTCILTLLSDPATLACNNPCSRCSPLTCSPVHTSPITHAVLKLAHFQLFPVRSSYVFFTKRSSHFICLLSATLTFLDPNLHSVRHAPLTRVAPKNTNF